MLRAAFAATGVTALLIAASAAQVLAQTAPAPVRPSIVLPAPQADPPWLGLLRPQQGVFGVQVVEVYEDSGAAIAGLLPGDEILFVDDFPVTSVSELVMVVQRHAVGEVVEVRLVRHNVELTLRVQLGARVDDREMLHRRLVGKPAPSVSLRRLDDDRLFDPSSLRGKVVVLAWFSTRCDACGEIISGLSEWASSSRRDTVVSAVTSAEPGPLATYLTRSAISVPVAVAADEDFQRYGLLGGRGDALVAFVVIDRNGIVRMAAAIGDGSDPGHPGAAGGAATADATATIDDVIAGARRLLRGARR